VALIMADLVQPVSRGGLTAPLWSAGEYVAPISRIISRAKDHRRWDAISLLARRLAFAVAGMADAVALVGPGALVPVPSTPRAVRQRGLDFTFVMARVAARHLRRVGLATTVQRLVIHHRAVADQASLTTDERERNLANSLIARPIPSNTGWLLVIDDVVTTGASLRETTRALEAAGRPPVGLATVAATVLREPQRRYRS
jgi:predicted amidophosphoribosyltransferase